MTTAVKDSAKLATLTRCAETANAEAQAALEQMFGYFSFAPMPTESSSKRDTRLAA